MLTFCVVIFAVVAIIVLAIVWQQFQWARLLRIPSVADGGPEYRHEINIIMRLFAVGVSLIILFIGTVILRGIIRKNTANYSRYSVIEYDLIEDDKILVKKRKICKDIPFDIDDCNETIIDIERLK